MGVLYQPIEEIENEMLETTLKRRLKEHDNNKQTYSEEVLRESIRDFLDKKPKLD
ncbi:MAG: hypothetical protein HDS07_07875 [Bacteroides sp.]|nr:hypothetical protein [Bacteroides sp.]